MNRFRTFSATRFGLMTLLCASLWMPTALPADTAQYFYDELGRLGVSAYAYRQRTLGLAQHQRIHTLSLGFQK